MASFKTLEIDTLRLRNLLISTKDNTVIPADYNLYSKGDGTTFWSTGVTSIQFKNLSTTLSTFEATFITNQQNQSNQLLSTLFGFSTFVINLSTNAISENYTNSTLAEYSGQLTSSIASIYETKAFAQVLYESTQLSLLNIKEEIVNDASTISSNINQLHIDISNNITAQAIINLSTLTNTKSTFDAIFAIENLNKSTLQTSIINNSQYLQNNITYLSTSVGIKIAAFDIASYEQDLLNQVSLLNSTIINKSNDKYISSIQYTNEKINIMSTLVSNEIIQTNSSLLYLINTNNTNITNQIEQSNNLTLNKLSTSVGLQSTFNNRILSEFSTVINTGLTNQIYQTFIQLEKYSAGIVESTIVSSNIQYLSTVDHFTSIYASSLNYINASTFNYVVDMAYVSSLSTLIPLVESNLNNIINEDIINFESTIEILSIQFSTNIVNLNQLNTDSVTAQINANSTIIGLQLQDIESKINNVIENTVSSLNLGEVSTSFHTQFLTAPSIIMNSVDNLVTIPNNIHNITGLQSLTAGIINLDLRTYDNFYVSISDISSDIFYGITYTQPVLDIISKDINIYIDITSSYTNKFLTIDTSCLSNWLQKPKIYNQGPISLYDKNVPQIYLSTFIGAHIVQMRLNRNILYVKDILTIPYIYTIMTLSQINIQNNITVNNPLLLNSTFIYSDTSIPISWQTNDLNVVVGVKFEGTDLSGNIIEKWTGPYSSAMNSALIKVPGGSSLIQYTKIYLSIFPSVGYESSPAISNIPGTSQVFDTLVLTNPIVVYTPTINCRVTIYNPNSVEKILEVSELEIYNMNGINVVGQDYASYISLTSTCSYPYQGDFNAWKPENIFDGSNTTSYRCGQDANIIDKDAFIRCDLNAKNRVITPNETLSSIVVYGSENNDSLFSIDGFILKIENKGQQGIQDGLFSKSVTLTGYSPNVIN